MMATGSTSLRCRQMGSLTQMLHLNGSSGLLGVSCSDEPVWKILIYDVVGEDILSPCLSVKALRDIGVTLHLRLHSDREPVPDVPAVYFVAPTDENLKRIARDIKDQIYHQFHFNFISPISRSKLEDLAASAIKFNATSSIKKLYDQYVNFISLENDFFVLRHQKSDCLSYHDLNKSDVTDTEMDNVINQVVDSLFSVCVTLGTVPIIRCPKGNAAEAVSVKLDKKLRENLRDARNSLFVSDGIQAGQYSFYRPVLVILDRHIDLATPLHHTWTYQALAHDVLKYSLNRVTIVESSSDATGGARRKNRVCDLDSNDTFWNNHKGSPFPQVAEKIQEELEDYRSKEDDIKRMKHEMGLEGNDSDAAVGMLSDNTQKLTSAVSSLPELLEKKRLIDMHTSMATCILDQIKNRKLDVFFELEEKIMSKQTLGERSLIDIFEDPEAGTPEDKMRLFIIYYLCSATEIPDSEIEQYSEILKNASCDLKPLEYLRYWKSINRMMNTSTTAAATTADYTGGGTKTVSMFSKLMAQSSSFVMEGVKNLVVKKHALPVTKITEEIMDIRPGQYQDNYLYFDPKILRGTDSIPRAKNPFQEAIVFMVGGGNYIEYQNLMDHAQAKGLGSSSSSVSLSAMAGGSGNSNVNGNSNGKRIVYGCTTLTNANQMMQQLAKLGYDLSK